MSDPCREAFEKAGYWPNDVMWKAWQQAWGASRAALASGGPFTTGEPEDDDGDVTVRDAGGNDLTADEIVTWLNHFYGKAHALELDVQAIARHRDEYRERAYKAEAQRETPSAIAERGRDDEFERMTRIANSLIETWKRDRRCAEGYEPPAYVYLANAFLKYAPSSVAEQVAGRPRGAYVPLTVAEIDRVRSVYKRHFSDGERLDTVCDMAINCLLYAEEIQRLRSTPPTTAGSIPRDPTPEMLAAGADCEGMEQVNSWISEMQIARGRKANWTPENPPLAQAWRAMWDAAPSAPSTLAGSDLDELEECFSALGVALDNPLPSFSREYIESRRARMHNLIKRLRETSSAIERSTK